ncbi:RNA polymerase, sigma subunit, ECF family [Actinopolyspora saharensis]|uniref:RNA polymerase, sigma subunit, ECF family n=1 Tax=Actinopolyspora saharensis TaxID=995062 RepID=A0A1H1DC60_9ACTN|nr:RNA polymerase, sigma subunit, ECF family [Actinopolyspora saharensis]
MFGHNRSVRSAEEVLAKEFDDRRTRLTGLAYRLTGSIADSEDVVRETRMRLTGLDGAERAGIDDLGAWLNRTAGALAVERARTASVRRKHYVGPWLPEPIVLEHGSPEPPGAFGVVAGAADVRMAAFRLIQQLSPEHRTALVLHDVFGIGFDEIAAMLECSVDAARRNATRARHTVQRADPPERVPAQQQHEVIRALLAALSDEDQWAVARALHPRATVYGDSDGKARSALRPVSGRERVARFLLGLMRKYAPSALTSTRPVLVNGDPGLLLPGSPEGTPSERAAARRVVGFAVRDGRAAEIHDIVNPDKLRRVPL